MTSLIALDQKRGTVLLVTVGVMLLAILVAVLFGFNTGAPITPASEGFLFMSLDAPLAQVLALMFWTTLSFLLGLVWSRALLGSSNLSEIFLVGALLGTAGFPLMYAFFSVLFGVLSQLQVLQIVLQGHDQAYALTSLFLLLLLGILVLIGREVIHAASKPL